MPTVIVLRPATLVRWAGALVVVLHALNAIAHVAHGFAPMKAEWWLLLLDVDTEANLPTWFSSGLLLACAGAACLMAMRARDSSPKERRGFWLVAALLSAVSADELIALHERGAAAMMPWLTEHGIPHLWIWAIGAAIVLSLAAILLPFLHALAVPLRKGLVLSSVIYVAGALGLEVIGQRYAATHGWHDITYVTLAAIEELLEMSGCIVFLHAVGRALAGADGTIAVHVSGPKESR